jgi:hypothetical protein
MRTLRDATPAPRDLTNAEFTTLRLRLLKITALVIETAVRLRFAFATAFPEADLTTSGRRRRSARGVRRNRWGRMPCSLVKSAASSAVKIGTTTHALLVEQQNLCDSVNTMG